MQKNIIYSFIDFLQYVEDEMNLSVQKFSFEPKDMKIWVINKFEAKDGFVLRTPDREYFYIDFTKDSLILSGLGESDIVKLADFNLFDNTLFDDLKKEISKFLPN